jgi:hypothetical protein
LSIVNWPFVNCFYGQKYPWHNTIPGISVSKAGSIVKGGADTQKYQDLRQQYHSSSPEGGNIVQALMRNYGGGI